VRVGRFVRAQTLERGQKLARTADAGGGSGAGAGTKLARQSRRRCGVVAGAGRMRCHIRNRCRGRTAGEGSDAGGQNTGAQQPTRWGVGAGAGSDAGCGSDAGHIEIGAGSDTCVTTIGDRDHGVRVFLVLQMPVPQVLLRLFRVAWESRGPVFRAPSQGG